MYYPSYKEALDISQTGDYDVIAITKELYSDMMTPMEAMRILQNQSKHCFMLESLEDAKRWGRYTFLGYEPKSEITCYNGTMLVDGHVFTITHPKVYVRELLQQYRSPSIIGMPPFTGGLVGYFSYDYAQYSEPSMHNHALDKEHFNDMDLMLFDKVICFDHFKQKIMLIVNASINNLEDSYVQATKQLEAMSELLQTGRKKPKDPLQLQTPFVPLFNQEEYCSMVEQAKQRIKEGDIFQIVLSNCLQAKATGSLFDMYRELKVTNPSPYMFYFSSDTLELAGASPETLVKKVDDTVYTYPLAGTRPRGQSVKEDERLEYELLHDEKELAEHNMLVDLGRNDLGMISEFGSVEVQKYQVIEKFSHVMHMASSIKGKIAKDKDALDVIDAILPAGTLSGAPKIKAMEIIAKLENNKRGIYGGAIGYLDFTGNLDTCIAIRLAYKKGDALFVRSGAGIVYDSEPIKEYQECLHKAKAVLKAIEKVNGGLQDDCINR